VESAATRTSITAAFRGLAGQAHVAVALALVAAAGAVVARIVGRVL
jgi:hypothetical protein